MTDSVEHSQQTGYRPGRIISPGTARQLGTFGLFVPAPGQRRTLDVGGAPLEAKSAEGGLLWIGFRELTAGTVAAADLASAAARFGEWAVDGIPAPADARAVSPEWKRLSEVVELLFAAGATVFLIGAPLPGFGPDSPFSRLLRVQSDEELPAGQTSGC
ncbi:cell division protein ZapE [Arthrobacter sp. 24S4-2]|uniref:cell division protein ZapE n=1 Tax=Arthrobacter sp. 24S4-2 TaxID=2575374 RepID=UPI0010C7DE57|nr:cell division protein ZapE [Arthrobacter sp. 24S4-2]QCO99307.1 cell division protein ZapE [Arthrobacter sp. 24S4-2]